MGQHAASDDLTDTGPRRPVGRVRGRGRSRGQVLVIFAMSAIFFVGMCAVVVDVAWYWSNTLRVQRAADAAALAGAVLLPGKVNTGTDNAYLRATKEATKNGYTTGGGVTVTPIQNSLAVTGGNPRELDVTVKAPVSTFFMRLFGINSIDAIRTAKAEYILPVPMGSPQNYYGVGLFIAASESTGLKNGTPAAGVGWTNPGNADGNNDNVTATSNTGNGNWESWGAFGLLSAPNAFPTGAAVDGIEVQVRGNYTPGGNPTSNGCELQVQLSWDGGIAQWTPVSNNTTIDLSSGENLYSLGDVASTADWGNHVWTDTQLSDGLFRIRMTFNKPSCTASRSAIVDTLQVNVSSQTYPRPVVDPNGATLAPQNFWGAMQSQGAPNIQGDAFMTKYQSRRDSNNNTNLVLNGVDPAQDPDSFWDPVNYYNYTVEMPAGATNGEVWIYDPGFCEVSTSEGTGENWTVGGDNGYATARPVSAYYELFDTKETPYDQTDDGAPLGNSTTTFQNLTGDDSSLGGTHGSSDCTNASWHNHWWPLANNLDGGPDGTTYRVHTHTNAADQDNTTALNSFAIWSTATGGTPRVYGSGAMEAYVRLPGGQASEFYLAQIASVHAGKTMQIDLWDPGDTGNLAANLQILHPTLLNGYQTTPFTYITSKGSTDPNVVNCPANGSGSSVTTNTGGTSLFNGCWLRITIILDDDYTAPTPIGEPSGQGGWWKIRYNMSGSTSNYSTDLTTWKVQIIGNPVHLIVP